MARERGGAHYVWGICTNMDKDGNGNPCSYCKSKKEIKLSARDEFVCPECGEPLTKVKGPVDPNWKLIGIIAAVVAVIGGGIGAFFAFSGSGGLKDSYHIKLSEKNLTFVIGENPKALLKATVVDKDSNEVKDAKVKFTWSIKDEKVATVTQGGEVTALKKGKTTITVKIEGDKKEGRRATCKVEVKEPKEDLTPTTYVKEITPSESSLTMNVGDTKSIGYTCTPEKHDEQILIDVTDKSVASFSADGTLTALKAGTTTITITADQSGTQAIVQLTVEEPEKQKVEETTTDKSGKEKTKVDTKPEPKRINLGYGIYEGPISGGKANGIGGEIRFTRSYTIDLKKASGETVDVNAGDKMINVKMKDNRIMQGLLKRTDGSQRTIIIG